MKKVKLLKLVDRYDNSNFAFVRPFYDCSGRVWLKESQVVKASKRAGLMSGSYFVCETPLEQYEIVVYSRPPSFPCATISVCLPS